MHFDKSGDTICVLKTIVMIRYKYFHLLFFHLFLVYHSSMATFQAHDISMQLPDGRWLFKEVSFDLEEGQILCLRGPSGVG
jgi:ABC-type multidrug transport system fused ATPase/permease subunit